MNDYLANLNDKQKEAVTSTAQYLRIIAGAGSGKTRVLTTRIAYLINEWGIDPHSILAITFTNKAANEMKTRIERMLPSNGYGAHISTIHSFGVTFLRSEIKYENYPSNFTILDGDDQKSIVKEALKELEFDAKEFNMSSILDYIGSMKTAGFSWDKAIEMANSLHEEKLAKIYKYYLERCHQLYALDFDDLLLFTCRILKKNENVRAKWQNKFRYILVDEFQDIDNVQDELITLLTSQSTSLYVVGDPDQTIYSWRGANIDIIMNFTTKYPDCQTVILEENYRSTKNILEGANSVIAYNKNRVEKKLFTSNEEGDKIIHFTAASDELESIYVVKNIMDMMDHNIKLRDIAILYRNNYLSRNFEKALMDFKLPYMIYGGIRFYERAEVKDMLSYLRLISVGDDLSLKRVINNPKRGIGDKTIDDLMALARKKACSIYNALDIYDGSGKTKEKLTQFKNMVDDWKQRAKSMTLEEIFNMVLEESGYRTMLETSIDPKDAERLENIKEILNDIVNFQNSVQQATLDDYLANVALYTDIISENNGEYVSMMTIHAAKGLEFDVVFIVGLSESVFPSMRSIQENGVRGLEEERRLAYVAFTRARKRLMLSDSKGYNYVTSMAKETSRFVGEIDSRYIEQVGINLYNTPEQSTSESILDQPIKTKYKKGDLVTHSAFGDGVIIAIKPDGKMADIAFNYPHMTKTIALAFNGLSKKV